MSDEFDRLEFVKSNLQEGHFINRKNVYEGGGNIVSEYPITVAFDGEIGVDEGGVHRDMFSAFWSEAYCSLFEGSTLLTPMIHPQTELSHLPIVGRILSHGYLVDGTLPIRIALPTMTAILLGQPKSQPGSVLLETFLERETLNRALSHSKEKAFPPELQEELMTILSRFGCRVPPTPSTMMSVIEQVATYEFLTKPAAGIAMMHSGIPLNHKLFLDT